MNHGLGLVRSWISPTAGDKTDENDLNRFRRFEFQYPNIGEPLEILQQLDVESSAKELLRVVRNVGRNSLSDLQQAQIKVIADRLGWDF
jgi:hypothetical protein